MKRTLTSMIATFLCFAMLLACVACSPTENQNDNSQVIEPKTDFEIIRDYILENGELNTDIAKDKPVLSYREGDYAINLYYDDDLIHFYFTTQSVAEGIVLEVASMDESPVYFTCFSNYGMADCEIIPARFTGARDEFDFYGFTPSSCESWFRSYLGTTRYEILFTLMMALSNKLLANIGYDMTDFGFRNFENLEL